MQFDDIDKSLRDIICSIKCPEHVLLDLDSTLFRTCGRSRMEDFIKEGKSGFDFAAVSSHSKVVNANRMRMHVLAYNLFNWFRRMALSADMRKQQVGTICLKLIKIAARAVCSARYITFKLCSSCPYKKEFYQTLKNIERLNIQLE